MEVGMMLPIGHRTRDLSLLFEEIRAEVQLADEVGLSGAYVGEHHQDVAIPQPLSLLAALASITKRLRLGTSTLLLPLFHPYLVFEQAVMVDIMSKGRLVLGVGMGYQEVDFDAFRVPRRERGVRFEEYLQVLRQACNGPELTFQGQFVDVSGVRAVPRPVQNPGPPILVGANAAPGIRRAARLADGFLVSPLEHEDVIRQRVEIYREACAAEGTRPRVVLMREGFVAESREAAREQWGPNVMATFKYYARHGLVGTQLDPSLPASEKVKDMSFEDMAAGRFVWGSPEDCVAQLRRWHEVTGADEVVLCMRHTLGPTHEQALAAIRLLGERVIPAL